MGAKFPESESSRVLMERIGREQKRCDSSVVYTDRKAPRPPMNASPAYRNFEQATTINLKLYTCTTY